MKVSIFLIYLTFLISCTKDDSRVQENSHCNFINNNDSFIARGGEYYCLDDINYIIIDSVNICPCFTYCNWPYKYGLNLTIVSNGIEKKRLIFAKENKEFTTVIESLKLKFITINTLSCDDDLNDVRARFILERQ